MGEFGRYARWKRTLAATIVLVAAVAGGSSAWTSRAQPRRAPFANDSLVGAYALVGVGGANEAASVGITRFDGAGALERTLVLNEAGPAGERVVLTIPATGSYRVNEDGTGWAVAVNRLPDGSTAEFTFDFVITRAERHGIAHVPIGLALHMVQREPGLAAKLVRFDLTRLPDE